MSTLQSLLNAVSRLPRGYSADGRSLGLGLANALRVQQEQASRDEDRRLAQVSRPTQAS